MPKIVKQIELILITQCATFFCFCPFKACSGGYLGDMTQLLDPPNLPLSEVGGI
jgi:hypothetical protein